MNVVIYSNRDVEPITVVSLPQWAMDRLKDGEPILVPVPQRLTPVPWGTYPAMIEPLRVATIWAESFYRNREIAWLIFTDSDELALELQSDVLPGQRAAYKDEYKRGFINALISALR